MSSVNASKRKHPCEQALAASADGARVIQYFYQIVLIFYWIDFSTQRVGLRGKVGGKLGVTGENCFMSVYVAKKAIVPRINLLHNNSHVYFWVKFLHYPNKIRTVFYVFAWR